MSTLTWAARGIKRVHVDGTDAGNESVETNGRASSDRETKQRREENVVVRDAMRPRSAAAVQIEIRSIEMPTRVVKISRSGERILQGCDIYIGRACYKGGWKLPQSKWHNPYSVTPTKSVERVVAMYETYIRRKPQLLAQIEELRGRVLGCWCKTTPTKPCHGDVLVRLLHERATLTLSSPVLQPLPPPLSSALPLPPSSPLPLPPSSPLPLPPSTSPSVRDSSTSDTAMSSSHHLPLLGTTQHI
jgi:hypothetical protein